MDDDDEEMEDDDEGSITALRHKRHKSRNTPPTAPVVAQPVEAAATVTHPDIWAAEVSLRDRVLSSRRRNSTGTFSSTHVYGISSGVLLTNTTFQPPPQIEYNNGLPLTSELDAPVVEEDTKPINQNVQRMLYYIEEPNKGKGFIKELCFSADGRIICSPYGYGFRLLAFTKDCSELSTAINPDDSPQPLVQLKYIKTHRDIVVSTKFSPKQPLLVSGCLKGKIGWHQPTF